MVWTTMESRLCNAPGILWFHGGFSRILGGFMFYHGKYFTAVATGQRIVPVCCEKCQTSYFYELSRQGNGSATAPYGLGQQSARNRANARAQRELAHRLASESELVACPKCQWVNDALIIGYRRARYRSLKSGGIVAGAIVWIALCVCIYFVQNPGGDPSRPLISALIGATAVAAPVTGGMLLLQWMLRRRIRPNRRYPHPPILPPGTPKAWTNGELTAAAPRRPEHYEPNPDTGPYADWAIIRPGHLVIPQGQCCECLAPSTATYRERFLTSDRAKPLSVPLCDECRSRLRIRWWAIAAQTAAVILLLGGAIYFVTGLDQVGRAMLASIFVLFGILFALAIIPNRLSRPYRLHYVDRSRGIMRIKFHNEQFTELVRLKSADHENSVFVHGA